MTATISETMTAVQAMPRPMRSPVKIAGSAAGRTTRRSTSNRLAPIISAARIQLRSTSRAPCVAFTTIG
ncbi:hypothetical protein ABAZ39_28710 (plasmid) [Azospirillum argentinense]|uniref:Uncharacterized protein n=1 Tax=Azospirillum argentinense TaxID=2970906 RepID=A0A060DST3_9PROT|nr:hypothetical protein ABAZ39_28710 [Azospirillum argentinense]EZQ03702.1 hypothetical protein ABAZ39_27570 [Azospirillum argentinense]